MALREYGVQPQAYRLPDATHVGHVSLQVSDLDRSVAYYSGLLGLEVASRDDRSARLAAGGTPLVHLSGRPDARRVPTTGLLGLYHFAILLPSRAWLGRFVRHLAQHHVRFASADHFVSEAVYLWDPDGLGIEVYADRPRHLWQVRNRELVLTTEPLDLDSLIDASGGEAWQAMPAGTRMGHVHLNVGDLEEARRFYHAGLGLDQTVWSYPGALFLSAGGYHHHLGTNTWSARARAAGEGDARLLEWRLLVPGDDDVARTAAHLQQSGYEVLEDGHDRTIADPWGTVVRVTAAHS